MRRLLATEPIRGISPDHADPFPPPRRRLYAYLPTSPAEYTTYEESSARLAASPRFLFYMWPVTSCPCMLVGFGLFPTVHFALFFVLSPSASGVTHEKERVSDVNSCCHQACKRTLGQSHTRRTRRAPFAVCSLPTVPVSHQPPQTTVTSLRRHAPPPYGRFMEV